MIRPMQTNASLRLRSSLSIRMILSPANAVVDVVPNASSEVLPANAVEDVVPNASSEVLPANAVVADVPKASTVFAVFAVIAFA